MQAGPDVPPSHAGLARPAEGDPAPPVRRPEGEPAQRRPEGEPAQRRPEGGVAPSVLQVAAVAASRLATEGPPQPFALTLPDDYELDAPDAALPPGVAAPPEPNSDEALMRAFAAGDAEAFTRLYDRHERSTWRFIRHRLGRAHEAAADDVMQEAWISVARAAPRYAPTARSLDAPLDGAADDAPATWADVLRADAASETSVRVESRQQAEAFFDALAQLPALQREAFVLQAEAGLSVEEIAEATGVGAETAKTRLRYARTRLRGLLADWRSS